MNGFQENKKSEPVRDVNPPISTGQEKLKKCKTCKENLPVKRFSKCNKSKDRLQYRCKDCFRKYASKNRAHINKTKKEWRRENRDKVNEHKRNYYKLNSDKIKKQTDQSRKRHPETSRRTAARWRKNNPEKNREVQKKSHNLHKEDRNLRSEIYRNNNQDKMAFLRHRHYRENVDYYIEKAHHRNSLKLSTQTEEINFKEICERDFWICGICHFLVDKNIKKNHPLMKSMDHIIPLSKGGTHTMGNIQLTHFICNLKANDAIKDSKLTWKIRQHIIKNYAV